jgi:hypothetical protein
LSASGDRFAEVGQADWWQGSARRSTPTPPEPVNPDVHTLTGAYALDALDPAERAAFEWHLAVCADCAAEVAEFRATAGRLGLAATLSPPRRLRERVLAGIARTRQESISALRLVRALRSDGRAWVLPATAVAAGVALLAAGVFAGIAVHTQEQARTAQAQLNADQQRSASISRLLAAPDVRIASGGGAAGSATLLDSHLLHGGLLIIQDMRAEPAGKTCQAWDISSTGFQSLGLLGNGRTGSLAVGELDRSDDIGVTIEPAGGSQQPTGAPIMDFAVAN